MASIRLSVRTPLQACAWAFAAFILLFPIVAFALDVPPLAGRVNDLAGVLDAPSASRIESALAGYESKTGHQFSVLIVRSLDGDPIEDFSIRVADAWKLGSAERDDGLLLLIAIDDRQARIEVGRGLEGAIPDIVASRAIREKLVPRFREGDYTGGIEATLGTLMKAGAGEAVDIGTGARPGDRLRGDMKSYTGVLMSLAVMLVFLPLPVLALLAAGIGALFGVPWGIAAFVLFGLSRLLLRGHRRGPSGFGRVLRGGGGFGGGWGGGGFGGGFGGGGGSFGGGGASGRW